MGYMKIYCDSCDRTFELYERDIMDSQRDRISRVCPHCGAKIPLACYHKAVLAFYEHSNVNMALHNSHVNDHTPLFTIDFIDTSLYGERYRGE